MDALPELLTETVGDATVIATVDIGGGDAVTVTPAATYVYRSDGLLSDESIETFGHETERLSVRTKRRKSEIRLETIDSETSFTVPSKSAEAIVEAMIEGILRTTGVVEPDETVAAQFRFSELTLVVTDSRLFEHVGSAVWDGDFEAVEFADLTGLDFEKGSVATQVVLETEDRRRRVKVPNEHAGSVRRVVQDAVFEFYGVSSIDALRAELTVETDEPEPITETDTGYDDAQAAAGSDGSDSNESTDSFVSAEWTPAADREGSAPEPRETEKRAEGSTPPGADGTEPVGERSETGSVDPEINALTERVDALTERVDRQTELLESQRELIEQLVDELRRGR